MSEHRPDISLTKAYALMRAGSTDSAVDELRAVLAAEPGHARAHSLLAACLFDKGNAKEALAEAQAALSLHEGDLLGHHIAGLSHLTLKNIPQAEQSIRRAIEIDPESAESHRLLGVLYDSTAQLKEARAAFEEALRLDPQDGDVIASYADFLIDKGEIDAAEALFAEAPDAMLDETRALIARGKIALRRGDTETAREMALWALQRDAQNAAAISLLVQTKVKKNPLMAVWLGWAGWMGRFDGKTRVFILIGLWVGYNLASRTVLRAAPGAVQAGITFAWIGFCLLTWIAPAIIGRMVAKELEKVRIKDF
jgi:Tfp pilus assembly protein PilF